MQRGTFHQHGLISQLSFLGQKALIIMEHALVTSRLDYYSASTASANSQPSQLLKIAQQLPVLKYDPLLSQEEAISYDAFAKFFSDKISRQCSDLNVSCNTEMV